MIKVYNHKLEVKLSVKYKGCINVRKGNSNKMYYT
jgi:hypothetical protein